MAKQLTKPRRVRGYTIGVLANLGSFWLGAHYSDYNRRWCVNLLPCITVWVALPGGKQP